MTPTSFLDRSAHVFADHTAAVDTGRRLTYAQLLDECERMAGALALLEVTRGDRVAVLAPNSLLMLQAHFAVPFAGGVLVTLNHRLTDDEIAHIVRHAGARLLVVGPQFGDRVAGLQALVSGTRVTLAGADSDLERLMGEAAPRRVPVHDEMDLISINYTSGTTGSPKGVMYSHRGAYLQSLAMAHHADLTAQSVMLWTLPMFHCNGWSFPWALTAAGGRHLCLPEMDFDQIWKHIREDRVTHLNAAPTVLTMLADHALATPTEPRIRVCTGGAPPSPTLLERLGELNIQVTHLYGLTETYGPSVICEWQPIWEEAPAAARAQLIARQGVGNIVSQTVRVVDEDGLDVPTDGETIGEVAMRGNNVMLGYYNDPAATTAAVPDGWFRTGDLAVLHPDGYIEIRDRSKDIIISGGENVSSVEVEQAIVQHDAILECAVVAASHPLWGETPVAFVTVRDGLTVTESGIIAHARSRLAGYKVPRTVRIVKELPKTSTGKIQKTLLRDEMGGHHTG